MRHTVVLFLVLAASAAGAAQPPHEESVEIDVPAFVDTVGRLAAAVEHAPAQDISDLLVALPSRIRVTSGPQHFDVPFASIAQSLAQARSDPDRWTQRRRAIHARLLGMQAEAKALLNEPAAATGADPRETLRAVLARREFTRYTNSTWSARLRQRIMEWLRGLLNRLEGRGVSPRRVALGLAWVATSAAVGFFLLWMYRTARRSGPIGPLHAGAVAGPPTPAREWALRALAAARAGQTSEAVRCAYRAALKRMEEQGAWRVDEARTAREYMLMLRAGDTRRDLFRDIVRQFEQTFYANRTVTAEDVVRLSHHLETLGCVRPHERTI